MGNKFKTRLISGKIKEMNWKIGLAFIVAVVLVAFGAAYYLKDRVGDVRPALLPSIQKDKTTSPVPTAPGSVKVGDSISFGIKVPDGYKIGAFARNLGGVRDLEFTPDGALIASIPSSSKVVSMIDNDQDGKADRVNDLITGLDNPHGLAFYQNQLYVAEETSVKRYNIDVANHTAQLDKKILDLPAGGRHTTRTLVFDNGGKLYISLGSTCDVCFEKHPWIGTVIVTDKDGNNPEVYAKGLRNAVFLTLNTQTNQIYSTEMGRDFLGDDLPPDEVNLLQKGDFGWPICYGDKVHDSKFDPSGDSSKCQDTIAPFFKLQAHSAPLGLAFVNSDQFENDWKDDLLVAFHGSWNRSVPTGYKVVRVKIENNKATGQEDLITGFIQGSQAAGRPVDVIFDKQGSLFISDDKAGSIYKMAKN